MQDNFLDDDFIVEANRVKTIKALLPLSQLRLLHVFLLTCSIVQIVFWGMAFMYYCLKVDFSLDLRFLFLGLSIFFTLWSWSLFKGVRALNLQRTKQSQFIKQVLSYYQSFAKTLLLALLSLVTGLGLSVLWWWEI